MMFNSSRCYLQLDLKVRPRVLFDILDIGFVYYLFALARATFSWSENFLHIQTSVGLVHGTSGSFCLCYGGNVVSLLGFTQNLALRRRRQDHESHIGSDLVGIVPRC